ELVTGPLYTNTADDAKHAVVEPAEQVTGKNIFLGAIIFGSRSPVAFNFIASHTASAVGIVEFLPLMGAGYRLDKGEAIALLAQNIGKGKAVIKIVEKVDGKIEALLAEARLDAALHFERAIVQSERTGDISAQRIFSVARIFVGCALQQGRQVAGRIKEIRFAVIDRIAGALQV